QPQICAMGADGGHLENPGAKQLCFGTVEDKLRANQPVTRVGQNGWAGNLLEDARHEIVVNQRLAAHREAESAYRTFGRKLNGVDMDRPLVWRWHEAFCLEPYPPVVANRGYM